MSVRPLTGSTVFYQLDEETAQKINERAVNELFHQQFWYPKGQEHWKPLQAGMMVPAIVTHVYGSGLDHVNLKLILDAPFDWWLVSIRKWNGKAGEGCNKWRMAA